jgi:hypothetical protein
LYNFEHPVARQRILTVTKLCRLAKLSSLQIGALFVKLRVKLFHEDDNRYFLVVHFIGNVLAFGARFDFFATIDMADPAAV